MRINKFIASATGLSRRVADSAVAGNRVTINGHQAKYGQEVTEADDVRLDGKKLSAPRGTQTIIFNKPVGYVVSRDGQGSKTIYDLLPPELHRLKPVGRLDKDSSGLLLLTNDGQLAQELTHPKHRKTKIYKIELDRALDSEALTHLKKGVQLEDGTSHLDVRRWTLGDAEAAIPNPQRPSSNVYRVAMHEGRNRQIRRTLQSLGYAVTKLHRTQFGQYGLGRLASGRYENLQ